MGAKPHAGRRIGCGRRAFKGETLPQLLASHGKEIMGEKLHERYGYKFPLLIKFIDSTQDLSIQVHPDDELAAKRHNSLGKTEMWYVMDAGKDAFLYYGFKREISREEFADRIMNDTLTEVLNAVPVQKETYFLSRPGPSMQSEKTS